MTHSGDIGWPCQCVSVERRKTGQNLGTTAPRTHRGGSTVQQCAAWLHCNSNPPTCGSQWGLCSKLVEECVSQVVVGVQCSSTVLGIGLIFKGLQTFTFSGERSKSRKPHSSPLLRNLLWDIACPLSLVARCGQRCLIICLEPGDRNASSFVHLETRSYLFLIQRRSRCVRTLCSQSVEKPCP